MYSKKEEDKQLGPEGLVEDGGDLAMQKRARELVELANKLKHIQSQVDKLMNLSIYEKEEVDSRSIYVGNVDYGATDKELGTYFAGCGVINRVTIPCNKFDGHPKGFGYIEFTDRVSMLRALAMDETLFHGRKINVYPKRTTRPCFGTTNLVFRRGRGGRGFTRSRTNGISRSWQQNFWRPYYTPY